MSVRVFVRRHPNSMQSWLAEAVRFISFCNKHLPVCLRHVCQCIRSRVKHILHLAHQRSLRGEFAEGLAHML